MLYSEGRIYKVAFEAAHLIEGHPKCGVKHGHSYHLTVYAESDLKDWLDFAKIREDVDAYVMKELDHQDLGNASAENIAEKITHDLWTKGYRGGIELFETEKYGIYRSF